MTVDLKLSYVSLLLRRNTVSKRNQEWFLYKFEMVSALTFPSPIHPQFCFVLVNICRSFTVAKYISEVRDIKLVTGTY